MTTMFHLYDCTTGRFTGAGFNVSPFEESKVASMIPDGQVAYYGDPDVRTQRIDVATGELVLLEATAPVLSLDMLRADACMSVDVAAGAARLRYITDVPGQGAVYLRKLEQARDFVARAGADPVPAYIAGEAQATSLSPMDAAARILAIASQWDDVLSPAIERVRIAGKVAIAAAQTSAEVAAACSAALATLSAI